MWLKSIIICLKFQYKSVQLITWNEGCIVLVSCKCVTSSKIAIRDVTWALSGSVMLTGYMCMVADMFVRARHSQDSWARTMMTGLTFLSCLVWQAIGWYTAAHTELVTVNMASPIDLVHITHLKVLLCIVSPGKCKYLNMKTKLKLAKCFHNRLLLIFFYPFYFLSLSCLLLTFLCALLGTWVEDSGVDINECLLSNNNKNVFKTICTSWLECMDIWWPQVCMPLELT